MSYLALARKWRPRIFADVMGQGHVVQALSHALDADRLHPAILLSGTRGVGKTTLARIIAKGLNCETGISSNPCGVCSACEEVDSGRFIDLLEIDAASNTGVDNVRELIDNSQYVPGRGRYKVYLIDEVHMLSKSAFNALLKTLEEPPPHVKFILATTDPQKLPVTVLSRCLQFNLKRLPQSLIREQLAKVLTNESVEFDPGAVAELARAADGSMRDGLSLLDQAIAFAGGGKLERDAIEAMLGTSGRQALFDILRAVAAADAEALLASTEALEQLAPDYAALLNQLAASLQRLAVLQALPQSRSEDDDESLAALAQSIPPEDVQLYYQIAINGRRDLPWAPDPRLGFEMTVLRMLSFRPDDGAAGPTTPANAAAARPGSVRMSPAAVTATAKSAAPAPAPSAAAPAADLPWPRRIELLELDDATLQIARQCAWGGLNGDQVRLSLPERSSFLLNEVRRASMERALCKQIGRPVRLLIERVSDAVPESPAVLDAQKATARQRAAEAAIAADPVVRAFQEAFGATVRPGSVHPLDS